MGLFNRKKAEAAVPEMIIPAGPAGDAGAAEAAPEGADDELIAVLAAAVAAYEAEQFVQTLYIQKINRSCRCLPAWGGMGTQEAIDTRRM